jgi:hypothetical protein
MTMSADPASGEHAEARPSFVVVRVHQNGDAPRDYLRSFLIVGRNGVAHLAYGPREGAQLFERRAEAEDIARRLRRRSAIGNYDYLVEEVAREATVSSHRLPAEL